MEPLMKGSTMKPVLKRAFQLSNVNREDVNLALLQENLEVCNTLLQKAKFEYANALIKRNRSLNAIIRDRFHYIISLNDTVRFNSYTNEIFVYALPEPDSVNEETE